MSQRLVEYSKNKGSSDNITVIVVFLTPAAQIATRTVHNHPLIADVKLNNMEPDNRYFSSSGQFDNAGVTSNFGKVRANQNNGGLDDDEGLPYTKSSNSSNGRHENGGADYDEEDDDEDDDLGPESNVDAVDEASDVCSLANVSRELFPDKPPRDQTERTPGPKTAGELMGLMGMVDSRGKGGG